MRRHASFCVGLPRHASSSCVRAWWHGPSFCGPWLSPCRWWFSAWSPRYVWRRVSPPFFWPPAFSRGRSCGLLSRALARPWRPASSRRFLHRLSPPFWSLAFSPSPWPLVFSPLRSSPPMPSASPRFWPSVRCSWVWLSWSLCLRASPTAARASRFQSSRGCSFARGYGGCGQQFLTRDIQRLGPGDLSHRNGDRSTKDGTRGLRPDFCANHSYPAVCFHNRTPALAPSLGDGLSTVIDRPSLSRAIPDLTKSDLTGLRRESCDARKNRYSTSDRTMSTKSSMFSRSRSIFFVTVIRALLCRDAAGLHADAIGSRDAVQCRSKTTKAISKTLPIRCRRCRPARSAAPCADRRPRPGTCKWNRSGRTWISIRVSCGFARRNSDPVRRHADRMDARSHQAKADRRDAGLAHGAPAWRCHALSGLR